MNFPGLDLAWSGAHHLFRRTGAIRPWSLEECRVQLAQGERVLIVATTALGDSLLTTPLIETASQLLGAEHVGLLVRRPYAGLYQDDPRLGQIYSVRGKYRWENLRRDLRRVPHRVALLANFTEPDLIPWLWWCGVRGFLRYRSRWTRYSRWIANKVDLRRPDEKDYASGHAIENNLAMAAALGLAPTTQSLNLPHLCREPAYKPEKKIVLVHPGASRPNKIWDMENWIQIINTLTQLFPIEVQLTGSRGEANLAERIHFAVAQPERVKNAAGQWTLRQFAQAQREALVFLSGDTGPYHLAIAVGCPTYTLFAPTDRGSSSLACGPHLADPQRHRILETAQPGESIATLSAARVISEVVAFLGQLVETT